MHRRFVPLAAWAVATLCAVALSWFGVRAVLSSTAYPQRPLAAAGVEPSRQPARTTPPPPSPSPTKSAERAPSRGSSPTPSPSAPASSATGRPPSPTGAASPAAGEVKTYAVSGGRVVFEMTDECALVSATPNSGWAMESWREAQWIRVDFVRDSGRNSVICSWHDHEPLVEVDENAT
ncbi:hypothetical protein AB0M28_26705 [Streptomyces sp. NPDC051940]|uniref:hypothetical protein n=1 Tax=Streptomyces sp. NPDC051940 TaxID=3155675 RepID=UPI003421B278